MRLRTSWLVPWLLACPVLCAAADRIPSTSTSPDGCGQVLRGIYEEGQPTKDLTLPTVVPGGKVPPVYPQTALHARVEGKVVLNVVVCRDGTVGAMRVLRAPSRELGTAAMDAVQRWTYRPAMMRGDPVAVTMTVAVDFSLTSP